MTFLAAGAPRHVSDEIERYARAQGHVAALVVPWESSETTLNMAVTLVKADGWAIEHTNIGTVSLTADDHHTRVGLVAHEPDRADNAKLVAIFERFARDLERHLGRGPGTDPGRS